MAPAERYEILLDVSDRKQLSLLDLGGAGNTGHGPMAMMGMDRGFEVLSIDATMAARSRHRLPGRLVGTAGGDPEAASEQRRLVLEMGMMGGGMMGGMRHGMGGPGGMMRINGRPFDMQRVDFQMAANSEELWVLGNDSPMLHPFHVHNTRFRVLSRDGRPPPDWERGFKDTVTVHPGEEVRILVPTGPYRDARHPYMFHCHILEHEDAGMMGQFTVV